MEKLNVAKNRELLVVDISEKINMNRITEVLNNMGYEMPDKDITTFIDENARLVSIEEDAIRIIISDKEGMKSSESYEVFNGILKKYPVSAENIGFSSHFIVKLPDSDSIVINDYLNILPYVSFDDYDLQGVNNFNVEIGFADGEFNVYISLESLKDNSFIMVVGVDKNVNLEDENISEITSILKDRNSFFVKKVFNKGVEILDD